MQLPNILVIIFLIVFYIIAPLLIWIFARRTKVGKYLVLIFNVLFLVVLFFGITSKVFFSEDFALIDIDFSNNWCSKTVNFSLLDIDVVDFIINIVMLIPIGLVVVYFNNKSLLNRIITLFVVGLVMGVLLETTQFILPVYRSVQLSDVVLNTISVVIGGALGVVYDLIFVKLKEGKKE